MSKFKIGDKVEVIANYNGHRFGIGEVVEIISISEAYDYTDYTAKNYIGDYWHLSDREIIKVENEVKSNSNYTSNEISLLLERVEQLEKKVDALELTLAHKTKIHFKDIKPKLSLDDELTPEWIYKKSPNQKRKEIIEQAKEFVEYWTNTSSYLTHANNDSRAVAFEFIENKEKRVVVCLVKGVSTNRVYAKGIAKCLPDDVYNLYIGKAIALGKAIKKDISSFVDAVQPSEVMVGMKVKGESNSYEVEWFYTEEKLNGIYGKAFYPKGESISTWVGVKQVEIIDDTNAKYE